MKNYYQILEIDKNATQEEIKKAYRSLALKYHPDKNKEKDSEKKFSEINEAYSTLSDLNKKTEYDSLTFKKSTSTSSSRFREKYSSSFFRERDFNTSFISNEHLNLEISQEVKIIDLILGNPIYIEFERTSVDQTGTKYFSEIKNVKVEINLTQKYYEISNNLIRLKLKGIGHEDVVRNPYYDLGTLSKIKGDLIINLIILNDQNLYLEEENIIQKEPISLYSAVSGEKIRIESIFNKKYDIEINNPKNLNLIKLTLKEQGILSKLGKRGDYFIRFDINGINLDKLTKKDRTLFLNILKNIDNQ